MNKIISNSLKILLALIMVSFFLSPFRASAKNTSYNVAVKLTKKGTQKSVLVANSSTLKIYSQIGDSTLTGNKVNYSTSGKTIVSVSKNGTVKCLKPGTARVTITSKDNKKKSLLVINVAKNLPLKSLKFNNKSLKIKKGDSEKLQLSLNPAYAQVGTVNWKSNNKKVATVKNGKIKAVSAGTAKISAIVDKKVTTCTVTVTDTPSTSPSKDNSNSDGSGSDKSDSEGSGSGGSGSEGSGSEGSGSGGSGSEGSGSEGSGSGGSGSEGSGSEDSDQDSGYQNQNDSNQNNASSNNDTSYGENHEDNTYENDSQNETIAPEVPEGGSSENNEDNSSQSENGNSEQSHRGNQNYGSSYGNVPSNNQYEREIPPDLINDPIYCSMNLPSEAMSDFSIECHRNYGRILNQLTPIQTTAVSIGAIYLASQKHMSSSYTICLGKMALYAFSKSQNKWVALDEQPYPLGLKRYKLPWNSNIHIACDNIQYYSDHVEVKLNASDLEGFAFHFWGVKKPIDQDDYLYYACAYTVWVKESYAANKLTTESGIDSKDADSNNVLQLLSSRSLSLTTTPKTLWCHTIPNSEYDHDIDCTQLLNLYY
ncbi:Ig-like domain-containing protein [Butyrivibrio sp. WCD2001]|uniref:Ig-like domain-containing protein n=1 Tax=Butyrivibrio sp. WCD2001 TaxID=1280681 RepID=UPI000414A64E|nr:Ig-like domain-containing protein [Butyrivibrio sp. WCD2001]